MRWYSEQTAGGADGPLRKTALRYVLGQLSPEQATAFAEHCMECPSCAAIAREVAAALVLRERRLAGD